MNFLNEHTLGAPSSRRESAGEANSHLAELMGPVGSRVAPWLAALWMQDALVPTWENPAQHTGGLAPCHGRRFTQGPTPMPRKTFSAKNKKLGGRTF